jgi:hypothetical protein
MRDAAEIHHLARPSGHKKQLLEYNHINKAFDWSTSVDAVKAESYKYILIFVLQTCLRCPIDSSQ